MAPAQKIEYVFQHLTKENGLVSDYVGPVCQDNQGFIWIGTQTGLQRYDGKRFVTYLADVHNGEALHTDWISAIFEDTKKRLWIGTDQEAVYLLDRDSGKFFNFNLSTHKKKISGVWKILEDGSGNIWISAHNGYFRLNDKTREFESMDTLLGLGQASASGISTDKNGFLWFATTAGLLRLSLKTNVISSRKNNPEHLALFDLDKPVSSITFDAFNNAWISAGYDRVLYRYNFSSNRMSNYSFSKTMDHIQTQSKLDDPIGHIFISNSGQLMISLLSRGIAVYNYGSDHFDIINAENSSPYGLHLNDKTEGTITITQDARSNVWVGTDEGINIIDLDKPAFATYANPANIPAFSPGADVSDFLQTKDGDVYVAYYMPNGGMVRFDKNFNFKEHYFFGEADKESSNQLWNLFQDESGIIWAPNQGGSISKLDPASGKTNIFSDSTLRGSVNQIEADAGKNIWLGHWSKGLIKIDHATKKVTAYKNFDKADANSLRRVSCILLDDSLIWVGTIVQGLQLFDKRSENFISSFRLNEGDNRSISNNNITGILSYNRDTLIIATQGGINIFDKKQKIFTAITSKNGLPNNLVQAIALDDNHNVWTACYGGLCKINIPALTVTTYDEDDGIINNRFNNRFYRLQDGKFIIGTTESFITFNPAKITENNTVSNPVITGFKVFDKSIPTTSAVKSNQEISLSYTDNSFQVEFASLQFSSSNQLKYFYRLSGVDKNWLLADDRQIANYNQLQPGHYVFEVKCANRNGIFSRNTTTLRIYIVPPFWRRTWFIALVIAVVIICLGLFIRWREQNVKALEAGKTTLQQLTAEKYKAQLESEQISNFFTTSLFNKNNVEDVLWDVAKNLIGKLGFVDCMIYLWNDDKTKLVQKAGYGPKGSLEALKKKQFDVVPGQGVVGAVAASGEAIIIADTSVDQRYRVDEQVRLSEICVPVKYNEQLLGIIDSEHFEKNFFTRQHLQILTTIATLVASKIKSIEDEQRLGRQKEELAQVNQQLAEVQLAALRSQMNPHFIFNALNSIKKFVIANEPVNAEKFLGKFSKLIRTILDNSQTGMVTVEKELQLLKLYLDLEQLRFGSKLAYTIDVDENIQTSEVSIPSMLIQPFVENAMLHGIMHLEDKGKIDLIFSLKNGWMEVIIEDNGVGRERSAQYRIGHVEPHRSIGIEVATKRLQALKKEENAPAGIRILDLKDEAGIGCGTKVIISIPI